MRHFDLFNGDADGIFALIQLRKAKPLESTLVSGVKRDIQLLQRITPQQGDSVTVLDVSAARNQQGLNAVLAAGAKVKYFDHHHAGELPVHANLEIHINPGSGWCTSLLVDRYLGHQYPLWAIAGAFGDNLQQVALNYAKRLNLNETQLMSLRRLGELVNYNGYGQTLEDLCFNPIELYKHLLQYEHPFAANEGDELNLLEQCYRTDQQHLNALTPCVAAAGHRIYLLPDEPWARRLSGTLANKLQQQFPTDAIAVLLKMTGGYQVSVRVPKNGMSLTAERFCRRFDGGGGRALAAGINSLPDHQLDDFSKQFSMVFVGD